MVMVNNPIVLDLYKKFKELSREDRVTLYELVREYNETSARRDICVGMKAKFVSRNGATIVGTIVRVNPKSVKLVSDQDRYGITGARPTNWSVSPQLLSRAE